MDVRVDAEDLRRLAKDLKAADKQLMAELRKSMKAAGKTAADAVKQAAPSPRIAGAVQTQASFGKRKAGVFVRVNPKRAPHAAPINNKGAGGTFRHPVYGTDTWTTQEADPFFETAVKGKEPEVERKVLEAMDAVVRKLAH